MILVQRNLLVTKGTLHYVCGVWLITYVRDFVLKRAQSNIAGLSNWWEKEWSRSGNESIGLRGNCVVIKLAHVLLPHRTCKEYFILCSVPYWWLPIYLSVKYCANGLLEINHGGKRSQTWSQMMTIRFHCRSSCAKHRTWQYNYLHGQFKRLFPKTTALTKI